MLPCKPVRTGLSCLFLPALETSSGSSSSSPSKEPSRQIPRPVLLAMNKSSPSFPSSLSSSLSSYYLLSTIYHLFSPSNYTHASAVLAGRLCLLATKHQNRHLTKEIFRYPKCVVHCGCAMILPSLSAIRGKNRSLGHPQPFPTRSTRADLFRPLASSCRPLTFSTTHLNPARGHVTRAATKLDEKPQPKQSISAR
ncbi:hypothetical protein GQ44DRAFT_363767 [Phaeosphaeriaceae sp. PMI808]|nr:hypothetical protein GQ44DRAFT_363767 [Phaeosphaeriaceae sp. PMI808]